MRKLVEVIISIIVSSFFIALYFINPFDVNKIVYLVLASFFLIVTAILATTLYYDKKSKKIKWLENRLEAWNDISYHVNQAGDQAFTELPIGILVYDDDFIIKWANKNLKSLFQKQIVDISLNEIVPELVLKIRSKETRDIIVLDDKYFEVVFNNDNKLLYFFDQTDREKLRIRYNNRITAIAIISIDNFEEAIKKFDMQEQSNIRGQVLGEISDYATMHQAYLQGYNDRLVLMFDREHLNGMMEDKFDVLNQIRDIVTKNHLKISVSIGVACFDKDIDEIGSLAQQALELAEKRGGDQAVVNIENEKIQYFGGKSNAVEKNTLVNARVQAGAIKDAIEAATNVLVMTHRMADCDAFASMLSVIELAKSCGKDVKGLFELNNVDSSVKKLYNYLEENDPEILTSLINPHQAEIKPNTLLISTDTQSPTIAMYPYMLESVKNLVVIDHHRHGDVSFNEPIVNYVEPYASSTIELVSELFMFFDNVKITPSLATVSLAGLVVDTNNFTYRTGSRTFDAASVLKDLDGDMAMVRNLLRDSFDIESFISSYIAKAEILFGNFAIVRIPDEKILQERTLLARISDRLLSIDKVKASFTIGCVEQAGLVGISARSLDEINVQVIMEEMGGGGHLNAAAYQQINTTVDALYNKLVAILQREYEDNGEKDMKVILLTDVKGRGLKDQIINVANGYGNYLITNKMAVEANDENIKKLEAEKKQALQDEMDHKALMEKLKAEIESKTINLYIKLGSDGRLFGHITTKQICDEFEAQTGIKLDKRKVEFQSEINSVGIYQAIVNLHKEVVAHINVNVLEK
ncbi:MAG: 50S ribosomal protein L9 [Anaeroplasmataceae bacterium]